MRNQEPLLFIKNPVIRKFIYTPVLEEGEESTSIFEMESAREEVQYVMEEGKEEQAIVEEDPDIRQRLHFLNHPFRKELYQPIEIVTEDETFKGKIFEIKGDFLCIKENDETVLIEIRDIQEIKWKQQSFII